MSYPAELEEMIEAGSFAVRGLIRADFGTGTYCVTNASRVIEHDGLTFLPNALISVSEIPLTMGTAAVPITIELPESADWGLTPDRLAEIENEDYKSRPVRIYDAYFALDGSLVHVEPLYRGYVDTIDHVVEDGSMKLVGHIETAALDNHRDGYRSASHEDQQLVSAGDRFFEHAATVRHETFTITLE